jgi:hypothetical protein
MDVSIQLPTTTAPRAIFSSVVILWYALARWKLSQILFLKHLRLSSDSVFNQQLPNCNILRNLIHNLCNYTAINRVYLTIQNEEKL